jgi:type IV pilus assembly protein PilN
MIKINLLPYRERKKKSLLQRQILILTIALGLYVLLIFSLHFYTHFSIDQLKNEVKASEGRLRELTKVAGEINVVRTDKRALEKKIEIIANLEKGRMDVVLLLNEMTVTVPHGLIWLTLFSETGNNLRLDGVARDNLAVANFMKNLESSPFFRSVDLNRSRQEKISNTKVQKFTITCSLKKG